MRRGISFLIMLAMENKKFCSFHCNSRKNATAYYRKLMCTSIPCEFQPKATIITLEKMSLSVPFFPVPRVLDPNNWFVTTRNWVNIS